jgi:hypothetical protein
MQATSQRRHRRVSVPASLEAAAVVMIDEHVVLQALRIFGRLRLGEMAAVFARVDLWFWVAAGHLALK